MDYWNTIVYGVLKKEWSDMDKEKIFEMVIREMIENALSSHRENLEEGEQQL